MANDHIADDRKKVRLIDANALIKEAHWIIRSDGTRVFAIHAEDVDNAPTVDAVEVVRCKDCKCAYINSFSAASGVAVCKKWSNEAETAIVQHDDFCSYGERKKHELEERGCGDASTSKPMKGCM